MEFFKINGKSIKAPTEISISYEELDKAERTVDGTMVVDIVGTKRRVDVSWEYLSTDDNLVNVKYHDLKHIVSKIESGKPYKHYVQEIKEGLNDYDLCVNSGNEILDVVLFEKLMICRKNDIKLIQAVDGALLSFMDEMDIYSFFGNILDNAIEGVSGLPADERIIYLTVGLKGAFVTASSANNCEREVKFSDGMPVTSKSDKANHGFGVRSMQIIAEKYNGEVSFSQKDNIFTVDAYFQAGNKAV